VQKKIRMRGWPWKFYKTRKARLRRLQCEMSKKKIYKKK